MTRSATAPALAAWLLLAACGDGGTGPVPPPPPPPPGAGPTLVTVAAGLSTPVFLTAPPGDATRLFVVEKRGTIRIVSGGAVRPAPFLDLSGRVSGGSEQGLLGLAFHPDYATNRLFVVNYTDPAGDTRISAFRTLAADPDRADPASEQVLLAVTQPFANHNGGMLAFGPDGMLYAGLGDGGSGGDPQGNGQRRSTLLGKLLRVAVSGAGQLSVPADNPFTGQAGTRPEIWGLGLRNPWRFSFDRATGDLYVADVGQNQREEVNAAAGPQAGRGLNWGWNVMEGGRCFQPATGCDQTGLVLPVLEYDHGQGCSVTGGYVYRGAALPALRGLYFYGDYCGGWVRSFRLQNGQAVERQEWPGLAPGGQITSFGEDAAGELYVLTAAGRVARVAPR
jgi:glucose/arabinose dehydrogenase